MVQLRRLALLPALLFVLVSPAQLLAQQPAQPTPPAGSNWQRVQAIPMGTSIRLDAGKRHQSCVLSAVDAESLTCVHGKSLTFARSEIRTIKISHRVRSALIAAAIGAGAGAGIMEATDKPDSWFHGAVVGIGAVIGAAIGAPIGALTDFAHSTVYRAP